MAHEIKRVNDLFGASRSLRQGLEPGSLGVVAARAGVGKSSCLVQVALDELVTGGAALHVSLDNPVTHVRRRYNDLIRNVTEGGGMPDAGPQQDIRLQVEQLRHIHCYLDGSFTPKKLTTSVRFLQEHMDLKPRLAVIDGFSFADATAEGINEIREAARETGLEVWLSALTHRSEAPSDTQQLPPPLASFADSLDAVVRLEPAERRVIGVSRWLRGEEGWQHAKVRLDPKTMLLVPSDE